MNAAYKNPVDTGRKLNVQKTFRRRPGRLLNVLYTFNLLPVPTGNLQAEIFQIPCNIFSNGMLPNYKKLYKSSRERFLSVFSFLVLCQP